MVLIKFPRWVLTAALLWVVWNHSHWSVALALTLNAIAAEYGAWIINAA